MAETEATITRLRPATQSSKPLNEAAALDALRRAGRIEVESIAALGRQWGWKRERASKAIARWEGAGHIVREPGGAAGNVVVRIPSAFPAPIPAIVPAVPAHVPAVERPAWRTVEHHPAERPAVISEAAEWWNAAGRIIVGVMLIAVGVMIALTSMSASAWQGHALTPDPTAGDIYARLSVLAEIIACLIPTGNQFYWADKRWGSVLKGYALWAVGLAVVFFSAGGFAITNINSGVEVRAERETQEMKDLRKQITSPRLCDG